MKLRIFAELITPNFTVGIAGKLFQLDLFFWFQHHQSNPTGKHVFFCFTKIKIHQGSTRSTHLKAQHLSNCIVLRTSCFYCFALQ